MQISVLLQKVQYVTSGTLTVFWWVYLMVIINFVFVECGRLSSKWVNVINRFSNSFYAAAVQCVVPWLQLWQKGCMRANLRTTFLYVFLSLLHTRAQRHSCMEDITELHITNISQKLEPVCLNYQLKAQYSLAVLKVPKVLTQSISPQLLKSQNVWVSCYYSIKHNSIVPTKNNVVNTGWPKKEACYQGINKLY